MEEIESRLASLAQKASSTVPAVRMRAYRNLLSKISLSTSGAYAELPPGAEHYEEVLEAANSSIKRALGDTRNKQSVEELLLACELCLAISREDAFSGWLKKAAGMKRIKLDTLVTTLHSTIDSEEPIEAQMQNAVQEVYNALCSVRSHVQPEDTQLFPVDEIDRTQEKTMPDTKPGDVNRLYEVLHAKMEDGGLFMRGWKFPTVFLSPMDEKHLMEMQTRLLTAPDQAQTMAILLELSGAAIVDYPAAVFLQQPGFLLSLLHLLTLPDTNTVIGTERSQDSTTEAVKAAVLDVLLELAQSMIGAFRLHLDGRFASTFEGLQEALDAEGMPPDAAEHYLVNRVQQYRYPRYDQFTDPEATSRTWCIGGAMYAFCMHAIPLLRSSQPQLFAKVCSLVSTCLPFCIDPTIYKQPSSTAFARMEHIAQLLAQTVSYYETMVPFGIPCERNMAAALSLIITQGTGADQLAEIDTAILCCGEVIVHFFEVIAGQIERALDVEELLAASPLLTILERFCFDFPLRAFAGERIIECEQLLCQFGPDFEARLNAQQAVRNAWLDIIDLKTLANASPDELLLWLRLLSSIVDTMPSFQQYPQLSELVVDRLLCAIYLIVSAPQPNASLVDAVVGCIAKVVRHKRGIPAPLLRWMHDAVRGGSGDSLPAEIMSVLNQLHGHESDDGVLVNPCAIDLQQLARIFYDPTLIAEVLISILEIGTVASNRETEAYLEAAAHAIATGSGSAQHEATSCTVGWLMSLFASSNRNESMLQSFVRNQDKEFASQLAMLGCFHTDPDVRAHSIESLASIVGERIDPSQVPDFGQQCSLTGIVNTAPAPVHNRTQGRSSLHDIHHLLQIFEAKSTIQEPSSDIRWVAWHQLCHTLTGDRVLIQALPLETGIQMLQHAISVLAGVPLDGVPASTDSAAWTADLVCAIISSRHDLRQRCKLLATTKPEIVSLLPLWRFALMSTPTEAALISASAIKVLHTFVTTVAADDMLTLPSMPKPDTVAAILHRHVLGVEGAPENAESDSMTEMPSDIVSFVHLVLDVNTARKGGNVNVNSDADAEALLADFWAAACCDQHLEAVANSRNHRELSDSCFSLLALAGLRPDLCLQLAASGWESAMGRILQLAPSTTRDHTSLCCVMQCVSLILRPSNFSPHERQMYLHQCLGVIMSESQKAILASIAPTTVGFSTSMSSRSVFDTEPRPPSSTSTTQGWTAYCLHRMLLRLILDACRAMTGHGRVEDDEDWQQFVSQIVSSQWLGKATGLLKHAITSYNTFKGISLVRLVMQTFETLYQLGHSEILFARATLQDDGFAEEDADINPMALTLISRAAKSVSLPDSFRGSCIRSLALATLQSVAMANEVDRAAMERSGLLCRDKQWLLRLATDRRAEIRYFALEWYQLVGQADGERSEHVVPDWLLHTCMDVAESPIVRMLAMSIAVKACLRLQATTKDDVGGNDSEDTSPTVDSSTLRMLLASACESLVARDENFVSAHALLAAVSTISLVLEHLAASADPQHLRPLQEEVMQLLRTHRVVPRLVEFLADEIILKRLSHSFNVTTAAPSQSPPTYLPSWESYAASIFSTVHVATVRDVQSGACEVLRAIFSLNLDLQHESMRHTSVFHNAVSMIFNVNSGRGRSGPQNYRALCSACELLSSLLASPTAATRALTTYAPSIGFSILLTLTSHLNTLSSHGICGVDVTPLLRLAGLILGTNGWQEGIHWSPPSAQGPLTTDLDLRILPSLLLSLAAQPDQSQCCAQNAEAASLLLCMIGQRQPDVLANAISQAPEDVMKALLAPIQEVCRSVAQLSAAATKSSFSRTRASKSNPLPGMARPYTNPKWRGGVKSFNMANITTLSSIPITTTLAFDPDDIQTLFFSTNFLQACMDATASLSPTSFQLLKKSAACIFDLLRIWQQAYTSNQPDAFSFARPLGQAILTTLVKMQDTFPPHELEQLIGVEWPTHLLKVVQNSRLDSSSRCVAASCLQNAPNLLAVRSASLTELQHLLDRCTHRTRQQRQPYPKVDTLFQLCAIIHVLAACFGVGDLDAKERTAMTAGTKDDLPLVPLLDWAVQTGTELTIGDGSVTVASVHGSIHRSLALAVLHALGALCTSESRRLRANMLSEEALLLLCGFVDGEGNGEIYDKAILCFRALLAGNETTRAIMKNNDKMRGVLAQVDEQLMQRTTA